MVKMAIRVKMALLMCLAALAAFFGAEAWRGLQPQVSEMLPQEIYARFTARADAAQYYLKNEGGYVAVYEGAKGRQPLRVTGIELSCLRRADRAMIEAGLPVTSHRELLLLLEDLGS